MSRTIDQQRKDMAFRLYIKGQEPTSIAAELSVGVSTVQKWIRDDDWANKARVIRSRITDSLAITRRLKADTLMQDRLAELRMLEFLEGSAGDAIINGVRPTTWSDVLKTLDYVSKQRKLLTGQPTERVGATREDSTTPPREITPTSMSAESLKQAESLELLLTQMDQIGEEVNTVMNTPSAESVVKNKLNNENDETVH